MHIIFLVLFYFPFIDLEETILNNRRILTSEKRKHKTGMLHAIRCHQSLNNTWDGMALLTNMFLQKKAHLILREGH
jgi:hypothetical protein